MVTQKELVLTLLETINFYQEIKLLSELV